MKLKLAAALVVGLIAGALLTPLRWQMETQSAGGVTVAYRFDRLTGRGWMTLAGLGWQRIEEPKSLTTARN